MKAQGSGREDAALESLEFAQVLAEVAGAATCEPGRSALSSLRPKLGERSWAQDEHALVDAAVGYLQTGGELAFAAASDITASLELAERGASVSAADLHRVSETERCLRGVVGAVTGAAREQGQLRALAQTRERTDAVVDAIDRAIDEHGQVRDSASAELAAIRRQQRELHERVRERCRTITHSVELGKMLSEPIVTVRAGRYVVPVRAEFAAQFPGVVHDQSASGATVFMEPLASVEANNRLRSLEAAEEREVARILSELSQLVGAHAGQLQANAQLLARLDSVGARARWGLARGALSPTFSADPLVRIVRGRHPLLRREAVPLDFEIGESFDAVVVSGPNMGGKTVALKTVGLFCLLAYAGIPVPAAAGTVIGAFRHVACVIGDEQSIADDLSSFSSHLRALKSAMSGVGRSSLILVDEIGSGTEPGAGAALAQASIEAMIRAGGRVLVTTHYTQLKTFAAAHDRVRNASMLFNATTLEPTYVFALGVPGQSLALALARTMALDARVVARAEALIGVDAQNLEQTFARLAADRERLEEMRKDLERQQRSTQERERDLRKRIESLEQEKEAFVRRAAAELAAAVEAVRQQLVDQARQRSDTAARQAGKPLAHSDRLLADTLREMRRSLGLEPALSTEPSGDRLHPGDQVYVRSFDRNGVINEIYDRDVLVTLGNLKTLVPVSDVVRHGAATGPSSVKPARARKAHAKSAEHDHEPATVSAQPEVDVRGMRVDEAWPLVDKALDDASLAGLSELRVIHGRGTGQLMRGIREFLDGHPQVGSVTFAGDREGGDGVTVVRIA